MSTLKKIIFLLLPILSFSCQTQLEKQGWQRIAIVSQVDTSTVNKKDKELVVEKLHNKSSYAYSFSAFNKDSPGKIVYRNWGWVIDNLNSDIAYYKWESDSMCLVKLLNQGNIQASIKLSFNGSSSSIETLDERKK